MAGTGVIIRVVGTMPTSEKCLVEIIAPSTTCVVIRRIDFTEGGTSGTAARTIIRSTLGGTAVDGNGASVVSVGKQDTDASITLRLTAIAAGDDGSVTTGGVRGGFTDAIATTGEAVGPFNGQADPQRGLAPWIGYIKIKQGTAFRIYGTAAAGDPYTLTVLAEE